jgi:hypothetical protein
LAALPLLLPIETLLIRSLLTLGTVLPLPGLLTLGTLLPIRSLLAVGRLSLTCILLASILLPFYVACSLSSSLLV